MKYFLSCCIVLCCIFVQAQDVIDVVDLKKTQVKPKTTTTTNTSTNTNNTSSTTTVKTTTPAPTTKPVTVNTQQQTTSYTYNPSTSVVSRTDTLRMYSVYLDAKATPFGTMYTANGKEIKREKYEEYKNSWEVTNSCKPCVMYTFDMNDKIKIISFQYGTCLCGEYTEYFADGSVRVKGQFQPNTTGSWQTPKERGLCNIRIGEWYYYLPNKNLDKIEVYENGVLKRVEKGEMHIVPPTTANSGTNSNSGLLNKIKENKQSPDQP